MIAVEAQRKMVSPQIKEERENLNPPGMNRKELIEYLQGFMAGLEADQIAIQERVDHLNETIKLLSEGI